jgi:heme-degrading monooxygenase HmoA
MGYVHISKSKGRTIEDFRAVSAKHNAPADIDGLLAWAVGSDQDGLNVVTVWQSRAHQERWTAEQLFPAFQEFGMAEDVLASSEFTEYETGELYIR